MRRCVETLLNILSSHRRIKSRWIFLACLPYAAFVVIREIPGRWEGARDGYEAHIPLRPATPREAAIALKYDKNPPFRYGAVLKLTPKKATIGAEIYALPRESDIYDLFEDYVYKGVQYRIISASWENYYLVHEVDRGALEKELGKPLTEEDINLETFSKERPSYYSKYFWLYALAEIGALTFFGSLLIFFFLRARSVFLYLPALGLADFLFAYFVLWYSPAFYDADLFYQRIFVEKFWRGLDFSFIQTGSWGLCSLYAYIAQVGINWFMKRRGFSKSLALAVLMLFLAASAYLALRGELIQYGARTREANRLLEPLVRELGDDMIADVRKTFSCPNASESEQDEEAFRRALKGSKIYAFMQRQNIPKKGSVYASILLERKCFLTVYKWTDDPDVPSDQSVKAAFESIRNYSPRFAYDLYKNRRKNRYDFYDYLTYDEFFAGKTIFEKNGRVAGVFYLTSSIGLEDQKIIRLLFRPKEML